MAQKTAFHRLLAIFIVLAFSLGSLPLVADEATAQATPTFQAPTLNKAAFVGTEDTVIFSVRSCELATLGRTATVSATATVAGASGPTLSFTLREATVPPSPACPPDSANREVGGLFIGSFRFANQGVAGSERLAIQDGQSFAVTVGTGAGGATSPTASFEARYAADLRVYQLHTTTATTVQQWVPTSTVRGVGPISIQGANQAQTVQVNVTDKDLTNGDCFPPGTVNCAVAIELRGPRDTETLTIDPLPGACNGAIPDNCWNRKPGTTTAGCCNNWTKKFQIADAATATPTPGNGILEIGDGEQFIVSYVDYPVSGKRTLVEKKVTWHLATTGTLAITQSDFTTAYSDTDPVTGNSARVYFVVNDADANTVATTKQTVIVNVRSFTLPSGSCTTSPGSTQQDQEFVTLTESSADSGNFIGNIQLDGLLNVANGRLGVAGTASCIVAQYTDLHSQSGESAVASTVAARWAVSRTGAVELRNSQGVATAVLVGTADGSGANGFATIRVTDPDLAAPPALVVRHQDLLREECNPLRHMASAPTDRCMPLGAAQWTLVGGTWEAKIFFNALPGSGLNGLTIGNGETFVAEYLDTLSGTGAKNQFVTAQGVWGVSYDAKAYFEKQSFLSSDTAKVYIEDRDVSTNSITARVTSTLDSSGAVVSLTREAAPNTQRFAGTFIIETASVTSTVDNKVLAGNNDTLGVTYEETFDATGSKAFIPVGSVTPAQVVHVNSPSINFDKTRYNEGGTVGVTVRDANAGSGPVVVGSNSYTGNDPAAGVNIGRDYAVATGSGGTYDASFGFEGPRYVTKTFAAPASPCGVTGQLDVFPVVPGSENVTDDGNNNRQWYRSGTGPSQTPQRTYIINYLTGRITFPTGTAVPGQTPPQCLPSAGPPATAGVTGTFTVRYLAYQTVTERFLASGQTTITVGTQVDPAGANIVDATPSTTEECMGVDDRIAVPADCSNTDGTYHRLVPDTTNQYVRVTVGGTNWDYKANIGATDTKKFNYDAATGVVSFSSDMPSSGALVEISYEVNNAVRMVFCYDETGPAINTCGATSAATLPSLKAFRNGEAINLTIPAAFQPFYATTGLTLQTNQQSFPWISTHDTRPVNYTVNAATHTVGVTAGKVAPAVANQKACLGVSTCVPRQYFRVYLTAFTSVYGNGLIGVREGQRIEAVYRDASDSEGQSSHTYPASVTGYLGRNAADVKWARDERTSAVDVFYGYGTTTAPTTARVRIQDPDANLDFYAVDTITVTVETFNLGSTGPGTLVERETLTLTETTPSSDIFVGSFGFEVSASDDPNGKLATGSLSQYIVKVTYRDHFRTDYTVTPTIWARWYNIDAGTLSGLAGAYLGTVTPLIATVTDSDLAGRVVNADTTTGAPNQCTVPAFDAAAFHEIYVRGEPWRKVNPGSVPPNGPKPWAEDKEYTLPAGSTTVTLSTLKGGVSVSCSDVKFDHRIPLATAKSAMVWVTSQGASSDITTSRYGLPVTVTATSGNAFRNNNPGGNPTDDPVCFFTVPPCPSPTGNQLLVAQGDALTVKYVDRNFQACSRTGSTLAETCRANVGTVRTHTGSWQNTVDGRIFVGTVENSNSHPDYLGQPYVFGAEQIRIRIVDGDANEAPTAIDTIQVKVTTTTDSVGRNVTLSETTTTSGIFEVRFRFNDPANPVAAGHGDRYFIQYTDKRTTSGGNVIRNVFDAAPTGGCPAVGPAGRYAISAGIDCNGATAQTSYRYYSATTSVLALDNLTYHGKSSDERMAVTLVNKDANRDATSRESIQVTVVSFDPRSAPLAVGPRDTEALTLTETQADSGIFLAVIGFRHPATGTANDGLLDVSDGDRIRASFDDPHNATGGRHTQVRAEADWNVGTKAKLRLNKDAFTSRSDLVELKLLDESGYGSRAVVRIHPVGSSAVSSLVSLDRVSPTVYAGAFGLETTDTDGVADLPVADGQTLELRFLDPNDAAGANTATSKPWEAVAFLRFKVITSDITVTLATSPEPDGENGWHTQAPTVSLAATDPDDALDRIEYRIDTGSFQTYAAPFQIATEGIHEVFFRAVNVLGQVQPETNATVKFDGTAPIETVTNFSATPVASGLIEIAVTPPSTLSKTDPLNFGSYKVFMDSKADPSIGSGTEDNFTVDPGDEEQHTFWVGIADAAGNIDTSILNLSKTATADKTPPDLLTATLTPAEFTLEIDAPSSVAIAATVETPLPADFDKVVAVVRDPFGDFVTNVTLTEGAPGVFAGTFTGWTITGTYNVSVQALDKVGNADTILAALLVRGIDKVPPRVELLDTSVAKGDPVRVRVTDNDRGVKSVTYTVNNGAVQTVAVSGTPLTFTFEVPTSGLSVGSHTLVVVAADANETANVKTETLVFQVTQGSEQTGGKPVVELVRRYAEHGGVLDVRVTTSGTLTLLTYKLGDAPEETALGQLVGGVLKVNVASLEPGAHEVLVKATALGAQPTSLTLSFTVLPEGVPLPPDGVTVTRQGGEVRVSWTASASDSGKIGGYLVHRRASPWRVIADVGASAISFTDADPPSSKSLAYTVTAYGPNDEGRAAVGSDSENVGFSLEGLVVAPVSGAASTALWIVLLVALAVLVAVGLAYSQRGRLFPRREEDGEAPMDEEAGPGMATVAAYEPSQVQRHALRCPACGEQFAVTGVKPIITTCPNCGRKGILR